MGFRESRRAAKKARKMAKEAQHDAGLDEVLKQAKEMQELAQNLPQGTGPEAAQAREDLTQRMQQMQAQALEAAGQMEQAVPEMISEAGELSDELSGAKFKVRFARDAYGPGDTVDGVLVATEPVKARVVKAELRYVDVSPDYVEGVTHESSGALHQGQLEPGTELPFTLRLPSEALPNWPEALELGSITEQGIGVRIESGSSPGRLYWAVVVNVDVPRRRDIEEPHPVPLSDDPGRWRGAEPAPGEREVKRVAKGWDVEIEPDRWALRRGEELTAAVEIGKPGSDREGLRVGLVCEAKYDVEETSTDADGNTTTSRKTRVETVFEDWPEIDRSAATQRVQLRVPEDAPFSYYYKKAAFGHEWKVVAREDKRLRRDPRREATIEVAP
jgi:hypothetical protein